MLCFECVVGYTESTLVGEVGIPDKIALMLGRKRRANPN
jgi:hypothetical protein